MAMDLLQVAIIRSYIYNARIMLDWRYVCKLFECDFTIELQNVSALLKIDSNVEKVLSLNITNTKQNYVY